MKQKRFFILMLMMAMLPLSSLRVSANTDDIDLNVEYIDPRDPYDPDPKSPILIPHVGIDDYTLTFYTPCDGCTLRLLDENDNVAYTTIIPIGTTTLSLPAYLSGNYEIQIIRGNFCFWGYINL